MAQQSSGIPLIEIYWSLVDKADKKFSKIRDLPLYERNRFDTYFYKVFKVYTELWKFQQENRQKLVEGGLKRWEIGEIASRIAQLYFGQYMRTSEASYLSESYVFYEAILTREYFKEGLLQDLNIANKQLRFLARFITVCLLLNRRHMVHQLVNHLKILLDECKRSFQEVNFREWKLVVQEIVKFLKADTNFLNIRPLRYSLVLDPHPDTLPHVVSQNPKRNLKLRDAVLSSYHPNEVKFSEVTLDTYRMLQTLEWEPSGVFYDSVGGSGPNGTTKAIGHSPTQDIFDPTLPANPRKAVLYRPSVTHYIAILASVCDDLPPDGVLLIYLSGCYGSNFIYPSDLLPFTRRPLFIIIDSESSTSFKIISGSEKGEPAAMLLSPWFSPPTSSGEWSWHINGSLFTIFLTAPIQAFCFLLGFSGSDIQMDVFETANELLSSSMNEWGLTLATSGALDPVWAQVYCDPFLRRLLLRFIFCRAVLTFYAPTHKKTEFIPQCLPSLPEYVHPTSPAIESTIIEIANVFNAASSFDFSEKSVPAIVQKSRNHPES
ncbi:uncharacterized protein LOC130809748 isoform X3 [Amaranthus tricolor]|uniref:uncharacterized protein LOC130809748 isoform X3 n=1 Tax=Amaranthus tricolor TaxID=29722 RepID=UPI002590A3F5|nr:uncharacterized protein LOC130809748 isoform X3 [Amaranthus tricolor]